MKRDSQGRFVKGHIPRRKGRLKPLEVKKCAYCGESFEVPRYKKREYCSRRCCGLSTGFQRRQKAWNKGVKGSVKPNSGSFKKGQVAPTKGTKYSQERIEAMSGENAYNWKGGATPYSKKIRNSQAFKDWRRSVFKRDGWMCRKCSATGTQLHPHHIKSFTKYPILRFDVGNGITFCERCHRRIHKTYGKVLDGSELKEFMGDVLIAGTAGGSTTWTTLYDHSAGAAW